MPSCGKPNFLDEFIVCLRETEEAGDAHKELAETIEKAYKSEMERSVSPEIGKCIKFNIPIYGNHHLYIAASGKSNTATTYNLGAWPQGLGLLYLDYLIYFLVLSTTFLVGLGSIIIITILITCCVRTL